ncbi:hypothetical protein I546_3071 [Mycobacterium kansasii 732]|nr:hypothetical protein I546_3071 [Mycobacterium kansasii 732]
MVQTNIAEEGRRACPRVADLTPESIAEPKQRGSSGFWSARSSAATSTLLPNGSTVWP